MAYGFSKVANGYTPWTPRHGHDFIYSEPKKRNQIIGRAEGGHLKIMDLVVAPNYFRLHWDKMIKEDRDKLINFIQDATINYKENTFTYEDHNANTFTVRFWEPEGLDFPRVGPDLYEVDIVLRKEI